MEKKEYVTYGDKTGCSCGCGCGGSGTGITGCRFSLSPMTDDFVDIILGAVGKTRTDKVWQETGKLSTIYRGKQIHVRSREPEKIHRDGEFGGISDDVVFQTGAGRIRLVIR